MHVKEIIAIEEVQADLNNGEEFYSLQEIGLGAYFRDCIISDIESLKLYGGIHSKYSGVFRMICKKFPYAIYYDVKKEVVIIIARAAYKPMQHLKS
ncbi:MAG: type II toxin-antitoxin system RelE/ParE family toxin [Kiritimatiellae bacterium]|nr:type II toxin-antitoxin system RelE/ParE family toxin [Kiritimatiellia bacterium]